LKASVHRFRLENQPTRELEGPRVSTGKSQRTKGRLSVDVEGDGVVGGVIAKGDMVGHVLAIHSKDKLGAIGDVEGTTDCTSKPIHARPAQTVGSNPWRIANLEIGSITEWTGDPRRTVGVCGVCYG
jgi:hypothetical protein